MKAAYTGWTWLTAKDAETAKKQLEQSFKECKFLGYDYVENFAFIGDYFEDPNELIEMEKRCGVELVNLYGHFGTDVEENIKVGKKQIDFLAAIGGKWYNCQHGGYFKEKGVTLCFHPHYGTCVFWESDIDYLMVHTDPRYVSFCIDTAHTTLAGMSPVELIKKVGPRLAYMHLKDVDTYALKTAEGADKMGTFRALGHGTIDFPAVKAALEEIGYDGILCVELDRPEVGNFHSAEVSRIYIRDVLDI